MTLAAALQLTSGAEKSDNVATATRLIRKAHGMGARFIGLPENFSYMGPQEGLLEGAETLDGPTLMAARDLASRYDAPTLIHVMLDAEVISPRATITQLRGGR